MNKDFYAEKIENLAASAKNEEFFNSNDNHAQIVLTSMVRYTNKYINIYCGNMCTDVSNDDIYLSELKMFLSERKGNIKVLFCEFNESFKDKKIYKNIFKEYEGLVEIKQTKKQLLYNEKPVHFTISDDRAYRLETDTVAKMARGNFNDPASAMRLKGYFDELFNEPTSLTI